ncbi:MAG: threonylcarbamoyl-AMP synthase [Thermoplasmata archaeon]|nr:threonylcarbamoyl-AMP synthase [Thermoplasmata archaeon]
MVYPTDTLWGLGARADRSTALRRVFRAKRRPETTPVALAVSSIAELERLAELSDSGRAFVRSKLPGAYTVLVRPSAFARSTIAAPIGAARTLGLRIPGHPVARELARQVGPITCTSANLHGAPATADVRSAKGELARSVAEYVIEGPVPGGVPSTLVDLTGSAPRLVPRSP